jgi:outer membrane biosynthesis protein TonB
MDLFLLSLSDPAQKSAPAHPLPPSDYPLQLALNWGGGYSNRQFAAIGAGSVLLHIVAFVLALQIPSLVQPSAPRYIVVEHKTPLYFPRELTQKAPNKGKVTKEIDLASLVASQQEQQRQQASPNASVRHFEPPRNVGMAQANKTPRIMPDAPNVAMNQAPADVTAGSLNGLSATAPPPPSPKPSQLPLAGTQAPPKIAQPKTPPPPGVPRPESSNENQSSPAPALPGLTGQIGNLHPAIELLSDPHGADFRDYLARILAIIRANWQSGLPQGVLEHRLHGRSVVHFVINRDGSIPRVILAEPSGVTMLDLYSSTIPMKSSPLPHLPDDFKGSQVTVGFIFDYNVPVQ